MHYAKIIVKLKHLEVNALNKTPGFLSERQIVLNVLFDHTVCNSSCK